MRITVISNFWPSYSRSGVAMMSAYHVKTLINMGHDLTIIGSDKLIEKEDFSCEKIYIKSSGSGSMYSPKIIDRYHLNEVIKLTKPDLVILEGWQTAITDSSINLCYELKIPTIMISHGISLHSYNKNFINLLRSFLWIYYKFVILPKNIKKLSLITILDENSKSNRFFDKDLSLKYGIKILPLSNTPINYENIYLPRHLRKEVILVIGYYSIIKNQIAALKLMLHLSSDIRMRFVGKKSGSYFNICKKFVIKNNLVERVDFLDDSECNLPSEIQTCVAVFMPSLTEAQPLTLLEAMASGTPFVAPPVGAIPSFRGGIISSGQDNWLKSIKILTDKANTSIWNECSISGLRDYELNYKSNKINNQLSEVISKVISSD